MCENHKHLDKEQTTSYKDTAQEQLGDGASAQPDSSKWNILTTVKKTIESVFASRRK